MKHIRYIILLAWLTVAASGAASQDHSAAPVRSIKIRSQGALPTRQLEGWLGLQRGKPLTEEALQDGLRRLLSHLQDEGYFFARVDSVHRTVVRRGTAVEVTISEGPQVVLGQVRFEGVDGEERRRIDRQWRLSPGRLLSGAELKEQLHRIVRSYEDRGYPYCSIELVRMELAGRDGPGKQALDLVLQVRRGPKVVISKIDVRGNTQTRRNIILRELGVRPGDVYSQKRVDEIPRRLQSLGYFKEVEEPVLLQHPDGSSRLVVTVVEGNNNRFDGVLGYNPGTARGRGFLTGLVDVSFGNLFGTGRQVAVRWEKRSRQTQQFQLSYREPWVAGLPLNAGIGFEQLAQDTSYVQRGWFIDLQIPVAERLFVSGRLSGESVTPDSAGSRFYAVPRSRALSVGFSLKYQTVNDPLNPRSGVLYATSVETGRKRIDPLPGEGASRSFTRKRLSLDFEAYVEPIRWQVIAVAFHGRQVTTGEPRVSLSDQYRLGGALTLRGYREEQFRGSRVAWSNLEYRYLLGPASRAFVFLDAGYFWRREATAAVRGFKLGYGIGVSMATRLGMLSIAYGLGQGDGLMDGKVHLRLVNRF